MHNLNVEDFVWPSGIAEKVLVKHELFPEAVEDSFFHREAVVRSTRDRRYLLFSRTDRGEYIIAVFAYEAKVVTLITARPMNAREKRQFQRM